MSKVSQALRDKVIPNYGPRDPGDTLEEWRACVRVYVPDAATGEIDAAICDAVRDGLMWWDGETYRRAGGPGPADRVSALLDSFDVWTDPQKWPQMPRGAWDRLAALQSLAAELRKALGR